ncbi:BEN domain-containing protein [Phthorimaea operculella]|nr:BEN domain-containing protein [Phthorimaea operculella]
MSANQWLLVEWVDEANAFPSYGVVKTEALVNGENDLHPGKMTFVRSKHGNSARRAQILRISDDKRQIKEHKMLLERQNHQVQNMLTLCMRTIKEMKTDPLMYGSLNSSQHQQSLLGAGGPSAMKQDPMGSDSSSDSDEEVPHTQNIQMPLNAQNLQMPLNTQNLQMPLNAQNLQMPLNAQSPQLALNAQNPQMPKLGPVKTPAQLKRMIDSYNRYAESTPVIPQSQQKRVPSVTSTAVNLKINAKQILKPTTNQAVQTDDLHLPPPMTAEKLDEMQEVVTRLHTKFLNLVQRLQLDRQFFPMLPPDEEHHRMVAEEHNEQRMGEAVNGQYLSESAVETKENVKAHNSKALHVRRVSAHTTNTEQDPYLSDDMVPIGSGKAVVPARLLNELNWGSYSSVTRRLLQAIFPRKVLATHSLTGKQSPAFSNKPAKKCLDPQLIDDIVDTVSQRCGVPKRSVRNCITIKCTDEAKLYRNRLQGRTQGRPPKVPAEVDNQENLPLSPIHSRASSHESG